MKRKLNELIRENLRLRHDYLKRGVKLTEENVKGEMLILLFLKLANILNPREWRSIRRTGQHLESQRMELYRTNQVSDQAQREKTWPCEALDLRHTVFQEDRARDCQVIEELRRFCCAEADRARQLKLDEPSMKQKENSFSCSDSGLPRQGKFLERRK